MDEEIIIRTIEHQENQILSMRREMNGIHASLTALESRVDTVRLGMAFAGLVFVLVAGYLAARPLS